MDEYNRFSPMPPVREVAHEAQPDGGDNGRPNGGPVAGPAGVDDAPPPPATPTGQPMPSDAVAKFQSCRWRCDPDAGAFCTHRDVLPFAGKEGFVADSWCPDCGFYKLRRTPKKRDYSY
jgi:hypothetical protein